jgi:hypothetical protein
MNDGRQLELPHTTSVAVTKDEQERRRQQRIIYADRWAAEGAGDLPDDPIPYLPDDPGWDAE